MKSAKNIKLLTLLTALLSLTVLLGCSDTFVVAKHGKGYFFGSNREGLYKMLCESGDLSKILNDTHLSQDVKDSLYKYNCTQRSGEKVKEIYASLAPEQRRDLRFAFQLHGYDINLMAC
jgi:hypothetical protein